MSIIAGFAVPHPPLIIPAVGRGEERAIASTITAYRTVAREIADLDPDVIVVSSPHAPYFRDAFHLTTASTWKGDMGRFRAPSARISAKVDIELVGRIRELAQDCGLVLADSRWRDRELDHGTFIPLYFIREAYAHKRAEAGAVAGAGARATAGAGAGARATAVAGAGARATAGAGAGARVTAVARSGLNATAGARADVDTATCASAPYGANAYNAEQAGVGTTTCASAPTSKEQLPVPIVRVGLSLCAYEDHRQLGRCIARAADELGRRVVFVASGDLSHKLLPEGPYGFAPEGPEFDRRFCEIVEGGDLEELFLFDEDFCEAAAECGLRSFQIMCGALGVGAGSGVSSELLSHEGPFGVGYGVARFTPELVDPTDTAAIVDPYVALARASLEAFVISGTHIVPPEGLPAELTESRAGAFVSIHKQGQLRGCIGTIGPVQNSLAKEIIENAIAAATRDPRFDPIAKDELDFLEISVDVLGATEKISSTAELDPSRYGVIVSKGWRRGLLLPRLEGITDVTEQVAIAAQKAGLSPFERGLQLERFEVVRHTKGGEARKSGVDDGRA